MNVYSACKVIINFQFDLLSQTQRQPEFNSQEEEDKFWKSAQIFGGGKETEEVNDEKYIYTVICY